MYSWKSEVGLNKLKSRKYKAVFSLHCIPTGQPLPGPSICSFTRCPNCGKPCSLGFTTDCAAEFPKKGSYKPSGKLRPDYDPISLCKLCFPCFISLWQCCLFRPQLGLCLLVNFSKLNKILLKDVCIGNKVINVTRNTTMNTEHRAALLEGEYNH